LLLGLHLAHGQFAQSEVSTGILRVHFEGFAVECVGLSKCPFGTRFLPEKRRFGAVLAAYSTGSRLALSDRWK
jgi:hypothetical protein